MATLPSHASIVIIGGGIVGLSLAYHLAKAGRDGVLLLERKQFTCGTTWHAAGLVRSAAPHPTLAAILADSSRLYTELEAETGQPTGYRRTGSIYTAANAERWEELKRAAASARAYGAEIEFCTPADLKRLWPLLHVDDLIGGSFYAGDGQTNPADTAAALARGARQAGAVLLENVKVTGILTAGGRVAGVETEAGTVATECVANCAGMWAREVGLMAGTPVPLHAAEHFYIVTEPMEGVEAGLPVMRDQDSSAYYKEDAGKLLVGAFEPAAKPWGMDGIPEDFCFDQLPDDWDHFEPILEGALHRVPALRETGIRLFFNGPESFTPDQAFHLGPAGNVEGFWIAAGFNSIGIQAAGGIGQRLAAWIEEGVPPCDLSAFDPRRMQPFQNGRTYLKARVSEALGLLYAMHWPYRQFETARGERRSPVHGALAEAGACFGEVAGWERANWFARPGEEPVYEYSYGRQNWFGASAAEHRSVREEAGVFDLTSFGKIMVEGPDAEALLQWVSANDMSRPPGSVIYTQWLNAAAGIEADLTITRLDEARYMVVTAAAAAARDLARLRVEARNRRVDLADITDELAVFAVMGPKSRALLAPLTSADLSDNAFPFGTSQEIELAGAPLRASRISYVGELGWELYVPWSEAGGVFAALRESGARPVGMHALDSLRIEKAYRHWGHDIAPSDNPLEAGLAFAVKPDAKDFLGREAYLRAREAGPSRRLMQFRLLDPEPLLYGHEPILADGCTVDTLTSANYGHALGGAVGLGYVPAQALDAGEFAINVAGVTVPAEASLRPLYDPGNRRMRGV
ncbi:MAG: FAD-dependent oxidoreductase [Alphaproteobacteria bacterium]|nr:FAD-dependent oxidoreductase [Alphaproteobacteria bacterium]